MTGRDLLSRLRGVRACRRPARWLLVGVLLCAVVASGPAAHAQVDSVYFGRDLGTMSYGDALAVLAFQGIVNRDGARLFVNTRTLHPWCHADPREFRNEWDEVWLSVYEQRGYQYETVMDLGALLGRTDFRPHVAGLVIYDPNELVSARWIAMTIAGVEDRLPVTPGLIADLPQLTSWWPDHLDLRGSLADKVTAYEWAIESYLQQCGQELTHIVGHDLPWGDPGDIISLDYAVAKRAFVFDLSFNRNDHPDEEALADTVVSHPTGTGELMGWNGEVDFSTYASERGHDALNGVGVSNLSFHRHMPPTSAGTLQQTVRFTPEELYLSPEEYYIAFVFINGNAPERLTRFFNGDWFSPARGGVPMSWTVPTPLIGELPVLFDYFYSSATVNDHFVGATAIRLSLLPNQHDWGTFLGECHAAGDLSTAAVFDNDMSPAIWDPFLSATGIQAVGNLHSGDFLFRGDHVPFLPAIFRERWPAATGAATIADDILTTMTAGPPPAFAVIYDRTAAVPAVAEEVAALLAPHGFVPLRLDEMGALASQIDHFHDVGIRHWAHDDVEACFDAGIVAGYTETHYRPTLPVTRDQMAVYISRALAGGDAGVPEYPGEPTFPDVPADSWALKYVEYVVDSGIVAGYDDGAYQPSLTVDRGQMAVYLSRSQGWVAVDDDMTTAPELFPDVPAGFWAGTAVEACVNNSVAQGYDDGNYHPEWVVTRDQMAVYISRTFGL